MRNICPEKACYPPPLPSFEKLVLKLPISKRIKLYSDREREEEIILASEFFREFLSFQNGC